MPLNSKDDFCSLLLSLKWCLKCCSQGTSPCLQGIIKFFQAIRPILYYKFKQLKDFRNFLSREVAHRKRTRILYFLIPREHRRKFITKSHPLQKHRRTFKISDLPNNTGVESEFLIPQEIPYKNTGENSQFLILQITQERIQNF